MMVVGSLISLLAKPDLFINAFKSLRRRGPARAKEDDPLQHIELPLWMSFVGVPIFSVLGVWVTHEFFGIPWLLTFISLPLIFVLTIICANSMAVAAVAAIVFEVLRIRSKNRFPISAVSVGLGVVLPPESCFAMWIGALVFWWHAREQPAPGSKPHEFWVEGCAPICAGLISGAALVGIGNAIVNVLMS